MEIKKTKERTYKVTSDNGTEVFFSEREAWKLIKSVVFRVPSLRHWTSVNQFTKHSLGALGFGVAGTVSSVVLYLLCGAIHLGVSIVELVKKKPLLSVGITFALMTILNSVSYIQMKYKLTSAEWQRDSIQAKLDSIKVMDGDKNVAYFRYASYKENKK